MADSIAKGEYLFYRQDATNGTKTGVRLDTIEKVSTITTYWHHTDARLSFLMRIFYKFRLTPLIHNVVTTQMRAEAKICVLILTKEEVESLRNSYYHCKCLYVVPPTIGDLESRLRHRDYSGYLSMEREEELNQRVRQAEAEIELITSQGTEGNFDAMLMNEEVDNAINELIHYLRNWFPSLTTVTL
jgi:Guanylate kinase